MSIHQHQHPPSLAPLMVPVSSMQPIWTIYRMKLNPGDGKDSFLGQPFELLKLNPESMLLAVKAMIIFAHTEYSIYPIRVELSPHDVQQLIEETGNGTTVYYLNQQFCEVRVLDTLAPDYIKFVFPLEGGPVRG